GNWGKMGRCTIRLLRGNETCGSERSQRLCKIVFPVQELGQTEIADKWLALIVEQNVSRFQIAMENSTGMGVVDSARDLCHEFHTLPRLVAQRSCVLVQTSLLCEFHAEKRQAVLAFAHLINRKDVRMIQTGHRLCFSSETLQRSV